MRTSLNLLFLMLIAAAISAQQAPSGPASTPQLIRRTPPTEVLRTGTQLVVVDVVVQDRNGHPVHGLKASDFSLTEDHKPQTLHNFEEHTLSLSNPASVATMPALPPGIFTDYTPVPPSGALNILLLDALNTPMKDQSYVRYELQQYVKKAQPGTRIAIFGLSQRLYMLQGFTSDPSILKTVVDHKLPEASVLLNDPTGTDSNTLDVAAGLQQFESLVQDYQTELRIQYTLDAFNNLAHYLAAFPGHKNLIWFSGSFPLDILPDDSLADPFAGMADNEEEYRETTTLLTQAQVAVYPVDARGLMVNPAFSASQSGRGLSKPGALAKAVSGFSQSLAEEHITMTALAQDTGGAAFYNNNDLAAAVRKAIEAGSNYYTITYDPTNHKADGGYRNIHVALNGALAGDGYTLAYRRGYYANEPGKANQSTAIDLVSDDPGQARASANYARDAMARGGPPPSDILFKVRVLPASTTTTPTLAAGNQTDPHDPVKGPFRNYDIDYVALPSSFTLTRQPNGNHTGGIEFTVFVYDANGRLLNADGNTIQLNLKPAIYTAFLKYAVVMHLEVSAPAKPDSFLRIGIHDLPSNRFGVVEVPVLDVSRLAPLPAAPAQTTPASASPSTR